MSENEPRRANAPSTSSSSSSSSSFKTPKRSRRKLKSSKTEGKPIRRAGRQVQSALASRKRDATSTFASPTRAAMARHNRRTARAHRKERKEDGVPPGPRRKESLSLARSSLEAQEGRRSSAVSTTSTSCSLESTTSCSGSSGADNEETVRVYVRVRPMGTAGDAYSSPHGSGGSCVAAGEDGRSVVFDRVGLSNGASGGLFS